MPTLTRKNDLIAWVYLTETQQQIYRDFIEQPAVKEVLNLPLFNRTNSPSDKGEA